MLSNFPINMNCIFLRSHGRIFAVSSSMVIHLSVAQCHSVNNSLTSETTSVIVSAV